MEPWRQQLHGFVTGNFPSALYPPDSQYRASARRDRHWRRLYLFLPCGMKLISGVVPPYLHFRSPRHPVPERHRFSTSYWAHRTTSQSGFSSALRYAYQQSRRFRPEPDPRWLPVTVFGVVRNRYSSGRRHCRALLSLRGYSDSVHPTVASGWNTCRRSPFSPSAPAAIPTQARVVK